VLDLGEMAMTPRMYFTLVLRCIGVWKIIDGLEHFVTAYNVNKGFYTPQLTQAQAFLTHGALNFLAGLALLLGAAAIGALVVPATRPHQQAEQSQVDGPNV